MKKVLAILLSIGFILSASESISAQQKPIIKSPTDTTGVKSKVPRKQIRKQRVQVKKGIDQERPFRLMMKEPVLLMKEKEQDTLQKKTQ